MWYNQGKIATTETGICSVGSSLRWQRPWLNPIRNSKIADWHTDFTDKTDSDRFHYDNQKSKTDIPCSEIDFCVQTFRLHCVPLKVTGEE